MGNEISTLKDLQFDCKLKAMNVKAASDTAVNDGFNNEWVLNNYMVCISECELSTKTLLDHLHQSSDIKGETQSDSC
ncbi:hypothetical protein [Pedobacter sp. PACM 27299]|uniref:hypothetical protein n=1 Tax=Pedobacter sp. PACM 27299 TaxID=1727164 RepID=UPI0012F9367C|nr:hypothetical protein [Pedobacter sp. PACM 27299]